MASKKVLIVASIIGFIESFNKALVEYLKIKRGCELHTACKSSYFADNDEKYTRLFIDKLKKNGIILHDIHFARSPFSPQNIDCYKILKRLIDDNNYDLIHVHTPTVSILTRLAARKARKNGTVVMYTCHGFHFHDASPMVNWLIYYPMEWLMSWLCDYIVTINREDYNRANTFHAHNVRYIPGVGVDIHRISRVVVDRSSYKESIGVPKESILLLSVGEMIPRKNHEIIIKALGLLQNPNIYYAICGKGPLKEYLHKLACDLGLDGRVIFLGFRRDIPELCHTADISAFPSRIEGLGLAGIEAMAAGVPLVSSNVHGIKDYVINGKTGFAINPDDVKGFANAIKILAEDTSLRNSMKESCINAVIPFEKTNAVNVMINIYKEILG